VGRIVLGVVARTGFTPLPRPAPRSRGRGHVNLCPLRPRSGGERGTVTRVASPPTPSRGTGWRLCADAVALRMATDAEDMDAQLGQCRGSRPAHPARASGHQGCRRWSPWAMPPCPWWWHGPPLVSETYRMWPWRSP